MKRVIFLICAVAAMAGAARADDGVATYALVVGSNTGGAGQAALRYAEQDARRVAATLTELGGYRPDAVDVLVHPTPDDVRAHLGQLQARVAADQKAGRQARILFYYSGHARAEAIDLGFEPLPLAELRQRLFAIPATLTVVVLDACQSGAFSRVKGAAPAADFSFNSKQHLDASGIAVLASSSGSELSQESEQLHSSYFTHHFLVGLRGAGDANHDGQVSIDEAYRYAYHQTLLATAETAVGGQHVTFEADLKGHGEIPLSYPRAATAAIELPAALQGQTLVEDRRAHAVVAETYKAKGAPVRIAVAPGEYDVLVRRGDKLARCPVTVAPSGAPPALDVDRCPTESLATSASKGAAARPLWLQVTGTVGAERHDGFTDTLKEFGYHERFEGASSLALSLVRRVDEHVWVGGFAQIASAPSWSASTARMPLEFEWTTTTIGALARGTLPFSRRTGAYAQGGAGLAIGHTVFTDQDGATDSDTFAGWAFTAGGGLYFTDFWSHLGVAAGYQFDYAPAIDNEIGDTHASGGHRITLSLGWSL